MSITKHASSKNPSQIPTRVIFTGEENIATRDSSRIVTVTLDQDELDSLFKRLSLIDSLREGNQARYGDQQPYGGRDHERAEDEDADLLTGAERRTARETRATSQVFAWARGGGQGSVIPGTGLVQSAVTVDDGDLIRKPWESFPVGSPFR